jgi:hypothetical protein
MIENVESLKIKGATGNVICWWMVKDAWEKKIGTYETVLIEGFPRYSSY